MLFSAVVLSCNAESHLEACIDSLVAAFSEFEDSEIFVVENGSGGRWGEVLKRRENTPPTRIRAQNHPRKNRQTRLTTRSHLRVRSRQ